MAKSPRPIIWLNPAFKLLICLVAGAMVLSFVGLGLLAFFGKDPPTQLQTRFSEACWYGIMISLPALIGLLGGRAGAPDPQPTSRPG
jgi:hypothetical protein